MPWPTYLLNFFEAIQSPGEKHRIAEESLYNGVYNALLSYLFPPTERYIVTPKPMQPPADWSTDPGVVFIVEKASQPVFFLEVKPPAYYAHRSCRAVADEQMRAQFLELADAVKLPVLHGVSALGTRLCFYSFQSDTNMLTPPRVLKDLGSMKDVAPPTRWDVDLLSEEGEAKMRQVVDEVKAMVAQ